MNWNVGTKIGAGFAVVMAVLIAVAAISYQGVGVVLEDAQNGRKSQAMLAQFVDLLSLIKDVEDGQRGYIITGDKAYLQPYQAAMRDIDRRLRQLRQVLAGAPALTQHFDALEPLIAERLALAARTVDARTDEGFDAAAALVRSGNGKELMGEIRSRVAEMRHAEEQVLQQHVEQVQRDVRAVYLKIALGALLGCALSAILAYSISRSVSGRLRRLTAVAERLGAGDMSGEMIDDARLDEIGVLNRSFVQMKESLNATVTAAERIADGDLRVAIVPRSGADRIGNALSTMVERLREQMRELVEGTNVIAASASEIVASTSQLAASASESAAAVSQTTATVEEVRQTAQTASDNAGRVAEGAQAAAASAQAGRKATDDVAAGVARVREQMDAISISMGRLSEQSQAISQIIASVEDLAVQSKLLAVNAAIEAAKAGEHGRGFAVVAQEIKSMADQSRQATTQVRTLLGDMQKATAAAVLSTEQGGKAVEVGSRQVEAAAEAIRSLRASVSESAQSAVQIATSSQQQMVGVDQVAGAMQSIQQATAQNLRASQQMESAARGLSDLGRRLQQIVGRYRVDSPTPPA